MKLFTYQNCAIPTAFPEVQLVFVVLVVFDGQTIDPGKVRPKLPPYTLITLPGGQTIFKLSPSHALVSKISK